MSGAEQQQVNGINQESVRFPSFPKIQAVPDASLPRKRHSPKVSITLKMGDHELPLGSLSRGRARVTSSVTSIGEIPPGNAVVKTQIDHMVRVNEYFLPDGIPCEIGKKFPVELISAGEYVAAG